MLNHGACAVAHRVHPVAASAVDVWCAQKGTEAIAQGSEEDAMIMEEEEAPLMSESATASGSHADKAPAAVMEPDEDEASNGTDPFEEHEGATWYWSEGQPTWSPNVVPLEVLQEPSQALCGLFQSLENTVTWCPNELDDAVIRVALFLQGMLHDGLQPFQLMAAIDEALHQLGGNQAYQGLCRMMGDKATQVLQDWGFFLQARR